RYGAKSVVLGRFFGPVRAIVPWVAGAMQMAPRRFVAANVVSALAWAPAYLAPGIVFGASLQLAAEAAARLVVLLLILIALVLISIWSANRLFRLLGPRANAWVQALLRWAKIHPQAGRIAQALADPAHPDAATLTALAAALLGAAAVVGISVSAGLVGAQKVALNRVVLDLGQSLHTPLADDLMAILSRLGSPIVLGALTISIFAYLLWQRRRRDANYWLAACGFALIATPTLAWLLRVPRPPLGLHLNWPWSFPSTSVLGATLAYGFLAIMLSRSMPGRGRWLPFAGATVTVLSIALARLYFGAEWLSDVVGSIALGLAWISALGLAFHRHSRYAEHWIGLGIIAVVSVSGSLALSTLGRQATDLEHYARHPPTRAITIAQWQQHDCDLLPAHRLDLWNRDGRAFDLAYAGDLRPFTEAMAPLGWRRADMLAWDNAMKLLSPSLPLTELPVIPHVHDGRHEILTLVKDSAESERFVLRLWNSRCRIEPQTPVWVGTVTTLRKQDIIDLIALPVTIEDGGSARGTFDLDIAEAGAIQVVAGDPTLIATRASRLLER
ncbi:MAG: LssY C-terminal domain-containing protein, partial [Thiohalocapsa sp.]